jgi:hypothetical protein
VARRLAVTSVTLGCLATACSPELVVGKLTIEQKNEACIQQGEGGAPSFDEKTVEVPWSTGFESGFVDYYEAFGSCYEDGQASCETVTSPVFRGKKAAAFAITAAPPANPSQTRCYLEGKFPVDAVYGAWFFIPAAVEVGRYWNLMYFQGVVPPSAGPGLWDVSLRNTADGGLELFVQSHGLSFPPFDPPVSVPIGEWFRIEFRFKRAQDETGSVALYQDGVPIMEATGIVTDRFDFHQWYVGTWGETLVPAASTVYVDDVTIRAQVGQ